jgi:dTDP-4-dehydrorhamnose reductase
MPPNILLLGKNGQVGWELQRALAPLGRLTAFNHSECDLTSADMLRATIHAIRPDVIVNAAAYTAVDKAESDALQAYAINATAPAILAEEARTLNALLLHYSTDYVFDGSRSGAYLENDLTAPLSVYGASKLAGEQAIQQTGCRHLIFRTSWVFAARGGNFAKTMLRLARERDQLKVVNDQRGAPTSAELIADVSALCLHRVLTSNDDALGLYHLTAGGDTTWHGYAQFVLQQAERLGIKLQCPASQVLGIPTQDYPLPAARPINSCLNTQKLQQQFSLVLPEWQPHVERMLAETLS